MSNKLIKLIGEGEHQKQDFKFCITDSRKIAKSLVAFANTDGGSLLIGVKDNGNIVGVQSDEEYYMVEAAARIYSKPPIPFTTKQWHHEGKSVLQVSVEPGAQKPYFAKGDNGKWLAYVRHHDENRLAGKVMIEVWNKMKRKQGITVRLTDAERYLLEYLRNNDFISVSAFARKATLPYKQAEKLLADYIVLGVIKPFFGENHVLYQLNRNFDVNDWVSEREMIK